jgi:hypothetical protein
MTFKWAADAKKESGEVFFSFSRRRGHLVPTRGGFDDNNCAIFVYSSVDGVKKRKEKKRKRKERRSDWRKRGEQNEGEERESRACTCPSVKGYLEAKEAKEEERWVERIRWKEREKGYERERVEVF